MILKDLYLLKYALLELEIGVLINWAIIAAMSFILWRILMAQNIRLKNLVGGGEFYDEARGELFSVAQTRGKIAFGMWLLLALTLMISDLQKQINRSRNYLSASEQKEIDQSTNPYQDLQSELNDEALTNANSTLVNHQPTSLAKIKSSYEDAFVSYFILQKCSAASESERAKLLAALTQTLLENSQKPEIAKEVVGAAKGSYLSLYGNIKCGGAAIANNRTNFELFLRQIESQ